MTDTDWYENDGSSIASGIYIVGDDLKAGSYTFTNRGEDSSMEIIIFETIDDYMGYYRTSPRSTIGEEDDAIQANSYYCTYVYPDETCSVNISDDNSLNSLCPRYNADGSLMVEEKKEKVFQIFKSKSFLIAGIGST